MKSELLTRKRASRRDMAYRRQCCVFQIGFTLLDVMQFPTVKEDEKRRGSVLTTVQLIVVLRGEWLRHKGRKLMKLLYPDDDDPPIHFRFASARRLNARKKFLLRDKKNPAPFYRRINRFAKLLRGYLP